MQTNSAAQGDPRFRILARLGRGGMSDVWLATMRGPGGFEKLVAVKQLRAIDAQDRSEAFLHEARLSAMLNHSNIVQTYEVMAQPGDYRIVMEFLQGQPLNRVLARSAGEASFKPTPIPLRSLVRAVADVLAGLHFAHEATDHAGRPLNVVHRDVSPHNIFVTWDGGVKLLDFGIAAFERPDFTEEGLLKGKITYMSPEQARGEQLDRRSDVFSIGIVLWEILAARRMWGGLTDGQIYRELTQGNVPDVARLAPMAPPELVQVVYWALAPNVDDRYPSAEHMRADLDRWLASVGRPSTQTFGDLVSHMFAVERERMRMLVAASTAHGESDDNEPTDLFHRTDPAIVAAALAVEPTEPSEPRSQGNHSDGTLRSHTVTPDPLFTALEPGPRSYVGLWLALGAVGLSGAFGAGVAAVALGWVQPPAQLARFVPSVEAPALAPADGPCPTGPRPKVDLSGDIDRSATLSCREEYRLVGVVRVLDGATLTVQPGAVVRGDPDTRGTLVVARGGRIVAEGTAAEPIRFTSGAADPKAGDWGGVVVLGRAPTNQGPDAQIEGLARPEAYGGSDPRDSSGALRYVQIWHAGTTLAPNNETNGLTLGGVGSGTTIDHVLVAHAADDCFEWFGGTVNASHLVCVDPGDDGFDLDGGYVGRLEDLVFADLLGGDGERNGIEVDNAAQGDPSPRTAPTVRRATLCGAGAKAQRPGYGIVARRGAGGVFEDIAADGFAAALDLRDDAAPLVRGLGRSTTVPTGPAEDAPEEDDDHGVVEATRVESVAEAIPCGWPPVGGPGLPAGERWDEGWVPWDRWSPLQ